MSDSSGESGASSLSKMPRFILRKDKMVNFTIINPSGNNPLLQKLRTYSKPMFREELIYQSVKGDFLNLNNQAVTIVNKQNLTTKSSHTLARYEENGRVCRELTSQNISNLIGKDNYDLVFSTLCSVISQEFKIRAILALLTVPRKSEQCSCKVSEKVPKDSPKIMIDIGIQTEETSFDIMMKTPPRRRVKRQQPTPYVVTDAPERLNRVVINPKDFKNFSMFEEVPIKSEQSTSVKTEPESLQDSKALKPAVCVSNNELPLLSELELDETSRDSCASLSQISVTTTQELMKAPLSLIENVDKVTERPRHPDWGNSTKLTMLDGTVIDIPVKPEDDFHVATPEILKYIEPENRRKLLCYQLYMDWKYCLYRNEDNYLALHTAVIHDDVDLVRRQCLVLKSKDESVDITTGDNETALQLSITRGSPECTQLLLRFGADPLVTDDEYRTCFHLAAEAPAGHLRALVDHCRANPMKVLQESEGLWKPELASKPKEYLSSYLLHEVCSMSDSQGDTPLMVASRLGKPDGAQALLQAAPRTVNATSSNSGNTALFRAVGSACHDSVNRGNKSKVSDDFKRTIELLVENGADPTIANHAGFDVNSLLADFSIGELSLLIAGKLTYMNTRDTGKSTYEPLMLIKKEDGTVNTVDLKDSRKKKEMKEKLTKVAIAKQVQSKNTGKVLNTAKNTGRGKVAPKNTKNTVKDNKNTVKDTKNTLKDTKITRLNNNKAFMNKIMMEAISSTDEIIDKIDLEKSEKAVKQSVINFANTSNLKKELLNARLNTKMMNTNLTDTSKVEGKKFVILEDKIISKPDDNQAKSSNEYLNHFKNFVNCRSNSKVVSKTNLKRKSLEVTYELSPNADITSNRIEGHPRVKTLRKCSPNTSEIDLNALNNEVIIEVIDQTSPVIPKIECSSPKKIRYESSSDENLVIVENEQSSSTI